MTAKELTQIDFVFDLFSSLDTDDNDDTVLIKKNVKIDYNVYNKLVKIAEEQDVSLNELIVDIYMLYLNEYLMNNSKSNKYINVTRR
jgi:NRPS condensation-like uncharacterized protein